MTAPTIRTEHRAVPVTHILLHADRPAIDVHRQLLSVVPQLDPELADRARAGDTSWVAYERHDGPPLWLFEVRDHGALLALEGRARDLWQYEIGNPLTAESMTRFEVQAGLYAPLRVVLFAVSEHSCAFAYDQPSSFFSQFGDEPVAAVGRDLDRELDHALRVALAPA